MSLESMFRRSVSVINRFASPKQMIGVSKYMYIKRLLDDFGIDLIFDVGANIGQFGNSMREIGFKGRIVSFEPVSHLYQRLSELAARDSGWTVVNAALGAADEMKSINVMRQTVFSSFQTPTTASTQKYSDANVVARVEEVHIRRLQDVIVEFGLGGHIKTSFLKCDTQGFDKNVLEGAGDYLSEVRMLMLEMSSIPIYEDTPDMTEMISYLRTREFAPVAFFPITFTGDWSALEFDFLGVNQRYRPKS
jgi:FkbM family methyltransferase